MTAAQLLFADLFFDVLHLSVIFFNLFGWAWKATRRAHRWFVGFTAFCWLGLGTWYGAIGYCPLTDWHWQMKEARGFSNLPYSYIDYLLRKMNIFADPLYIDIGVATAFAAVVMVTLSFWWRERCADFLRPVVS